MRKKETYYLDKKKLKQNFDSFSKLGNVCYPTKTNSSFEILSFLKPFIEENEENYFLISTPAHFEKLSSLDVAPNKMSLINVLATDDFIQKLYYAGVRFFSFDNICSLDKFLEYADDKTCKISLKLNIDNAFFSHSHLGCSIDEFKKIQSKIKDKFDDVGISFYLPHSLKLKKGSLQKMLKYLAKNLINCPPAFVCIAGLKAATTIDNNVINKIKSSLKLKNIYLEPGQYLLEDTLDLSTPIIRFNENKKDLIIQRGLYSGMLDRLLFKKQFDLYFNYEKHKIKLEKNFHIGFTKINVYGGSGNNEDFLGKYYIKKDKLSLIKKQDDIVISNVGAYFEEFILPTQFDSLAEYEDIKGENDEI